MLTSCWAPSFPSIGGSFNSMLSKYHHHTKSPSPKVSDSVNEVPQNLIFIIREHIELLPFSCYIVNFQWGLWPNHWPHATNIQSMNLPLLSGNAEQEATPYASLWPAPLSNCPQCIKIMSRHCSCMRLMQVTCPMASIDHDVLLNQPLPPLILIYSPICLVLDHKPAVGQIKQRWQETVRPGPCCWLSSCFR